MTTQETTASSRREELLELAYAYVLRHGLADLSLRPLAADIGSSPRVLLFLFGNKDGLIRELLSRARAEELSLLAELNTRPGGSLSNVAGELWGWLSEPERRPVLALWVESFARSLVDPTGPWADFARTTVNDWLNLLAATQDPAARNTGQGRSDRTMVLAVLRGALLDLLATGDKARTTKAVTAQLATQAKSD
ncbi:TetR/AcrR family transcriptional regulator [Paenarthrobacter ureafaciens]|uniref:TetR/AcrR family transcriptional regulator n=1 Tax=Paenarthrobacter ureafaciens TaxID=37931 RepID=UPI001407A3FA|nr:TetR/AcrR family transcriptional regulator [Paenarthrobacter ureafaciens]MCX8455039.1 TetR/AcrR family transcriptional regulator [Paenarthrobacter ureafaciens]MCY0974455.1 TetR/AcrR family transcriptional regulator [Paenarthrobacter ureafaciens]WNZ05064.1 TetR/AcrR family transcriptional regulator [Paenarthrobacter ureafaciens]